MVTSRGILPSSVAHGLALALREAGERLVEQQHLGLLRQRHRELQPPPLAIGGFGDDAFGAVAEPDLRQRLARLRRRGAVAGQHAPRDSSAACRGRAAPAPRCAAASRAGTASGSDRCGRARDARGLASRMPSSSWPNSLTEPPSAVRSPVMRLNSVVLPAPFGPMISRRSPGMTVSETFLVAGSPPKRLLRPAISSAARSCGRLRRAGLAGAACRALAACAATAAGSPARGRRA